MRGKRSQGPRLGDKALLPGAGSWVPRGCHGVAHGCESLSRSLASQSEMAAFSEFSGCWAPAVLGVCWPVAAEPHPRFQTPPFARRPGSYWMRAWPRASSLRADAVPKCVTVTRQGAGTAACERGRDTARPAPWSPRPSPSQAAVTVGAQGSATPTRPGVPAVPSSRSQGATPAPRPHAGEAPGTPEPRVLLTAPGAPPATSTQKVSVRNGARSLPSSVCSRQDTGVRTSRSQIRAMAKAAPLRRGRGGVCWKRGGCHLWAWLRGVAVETRELPR